MGRYLLAYRNELCVVYDGILYYCGVKGNSWIKDKSLATPLDKTEIMRMACRYRWVGNSTGIYTIPYEE